jgi:DNA-binding transcriptional regulator YdaS (Cro superfamily)
MDHSTIIDGLGGTFAVARAVGCDPSRVSRWRKVGIPAERFPVIVKLAKRHGLPEVTLEALYAGRLALVRRAARRARVAA